ncbi:MAG: hypothetical protein K6G32_07680 [Prevotella sp.]|nr:hypothetical protein [Prevotella sp.]
MNNYLMTGVAAIAFLAAVTSCSKSTDLFDQEAFDEKNRIEQELQINEKYAAAFEKAFGKVGSNVDWGFSSRNAGARAITRDGGVAFPTTITFPEDCDPNKFLSDVPAGVLSYNDYLNTLGTQWWHPEYLNTSGEVYIDQVQAFQITGGEERSKLYLKPGTYDFSNVTFDLCKNADLYLLSGVTLILNNTAASTAKFDIYIAEGAELIADGKDGLVADAGAHIYNHGTITCSKFEANTTSVLYNSGKMNVTGTVSAESNSSDGGQSFIVNNGTIECADVVVNAGAVLNIFEWNVFGTTEINSNNSGWINNGHWTTNNYAYIAGSPNVINNCYLLVTNDFDMNITSLAGEANGSFKMNTGGSVVTENFYGGRDLSDGVVKGGPFRIDMAEYSLFKVNNKATLESGRGAMAEGEVGFGFFGPKTGGYAVFQAKDIVRDETLAAQKNHGAVTYSGNLYVSAETHFAQGYDSDGSGTYVPRPFIYEKDGFSIANNIYAAGSGFKPGKPSITIPKTDCCPGFEGGDPLYRVIAEDLSAAQAGDFDFNDVVFDVVKAEGGKTTLKLICAGGVLPLKVGGVEVHGLFDPTATEDEKGQYKMYNTGAGPDKDPVTFVVNGEYKTPEEINNIKIEVFKENQWMELTATRGKAACKILVDDTFEPVKERQNIADENENFTNYVQGAFVDDFWWK